MKTVQPEFGDVPVWDKITRAWHWLLAISVISGWLIGEFRNFYIMQWHFYAGYCTGGLLLFRIYWGFAGPPAVRFKNLFPAPSELIAYIKDMFTRQPSGLPGHSPLGAIATLVILAMLIFQVGTGLFSEDDGLFYEGPLAGYVSSDIVGKATSLHHESAHFLLILFGLHLGVMVFYFFWKKENLVKAMIIGKKRVRLDADSGNS